MSRYKTIQTEFRTLDSLMKALEDIGYGKGKVQVATNPTANTLPMIGYHGDTRPETTAVRIPRQYVGSASNDVGFRWNGKAYEAVISQYDSETHFNEGVVNKLKQRYGLHEIRRQAKARGYNIRESVNADGSIQVQCVKRG